MPEERALRTPGNATARRTSTDVGANAAAVAQQNAEVQVGTIVLKPGRGNSKGTKGQVIRNDLVDVFTILFEDGDTSENDSRELLDVLFQASADDPESFGQTFKEVKRKPVVGDRISKNFDGKFFRGQLTAVKQERVYWVKWNDKKLEDFDSESIRDLVQSSDPRGVLLEVMDMDPHTRVCTCRWKDKDDLTYEPAESLPRARVFDFELKQKHASQPKQTYPEHPHLPAQKAKWRVSKHAAYLAQAAPKHNARIVPDEKEAKEERKGWTATPSVPITLPIYVPGKTRTQDGEPGYMHLQGKDAEYFQFEKLYVPDSVYEYVADQATLYAKQEIRKRLEKGLKITNVQYYFLSLGDIVLGRSMSHIVKWDLLSEAERKLRLSFWINCLDDDSVKFTKEHIIAWRVCTLIMYGVHGIKYCWRLCWSDNPIAEIPFLKSLCSRDLFECVHRYVHFEDNSTNENIEDCSWKYRTVSDLLKTLLLANKQIPQDYDIDEGTLDTASKKVPNATRKRHKPSENMGVTINKLCDREGYCYTWEEEH
ncbi:hypothetical protein CYMTET_21194 [Cymbomonas tetramitiformis]|uniref:Uncharacterized protein n=1 Tax=Cymbomonas tetramitiformis TaxID=36881 RepID=A0AAE0L3H9_9CHLO|nr:hypothetical protein CYMTET_21194 [Cymbomonas tetramitiformis]